MFSNFNLQIGLVHLLQRLMIKTLKRKIQFSNDKDMRKVFLLQSIVNFYNVLTLGAQCLRHKIIKINKIVIHDAGLVIFSLAECWTIDDQYSLTKRQSYIFIVGGRG